MFSNLFFKENFITLSSLTDFQDQQYFSLWNMTCDWLIIIGCSALVEFIALYNNTVL